MGWLDRLLSGTSPQTFSQELELVIARWTNPAREGSFTNLQIAERLEEKATEIRHAWNRPPPITSQGA